jgi:hypothetical protein
VHPSEVSRAIAMIARRRAKVDDRNRDRLPDAPDADPREVLDYLLKYSGTNIPRWVLQADVGDALTLNNWLWWEDRRRELHFLKAGRDRGLFLTQLGAQLGIGKQGVIDRIDRLEALLRYDRPDEKLSRESRRNERNARDRRAVELAWIDRHRRALTDVITALLEHADRYHLADDDREWLDELAVDLRAGELSPATMVMLGLAAAELRAAPAVLALAGPRPYRVHTVLARAETLRSRYTQLDGCDTLLREPVSLDVAATPPADAGLSVGYTANQVSAT